MSKSTWYYIAWFFYFVNFIALIFLASNHVYAAEVNCYSGKTRIYHGFGDEFTFSENFMSFTEYKTKHLILLRADCIILAPILTGDKFNAIDTGQEKYWA